MLSGGNKKPPEAPDSIRLIRVVLGINLSSRLEPPRHLFPMSEIESDGRILPVGETINAFGPYKRPGETTCLRK